MRGSCATLAAALLVIALMGCANAGEGRVEAGRRVYVRECARCHMLDGAGVAGVYPNLANDPIVTLRSAEPTIQIVLEGRESMPAFAGQLPTQELADVMTYIRHAWGNDASAVTQAQAK